MGKRKTKLEVSHIPFSHIVGKWLALRYTMRMHVLECHLFFYNLKKRNLNFDFQFPRKQKLKIKHKISIFNLQEKRKLKFDTNFQFSIFVENRNCNSDANFHISIFRVFLTSSTESLERTKTGRQQKPIVLAPEF